jgi:lipoyl synthase
VDLPEWIKQKAPDIKQLNTIKNTLERLKLHTVCESAHCPNIGECFGKGLATVLIMGDRCTRNCRFCAVEKDYPLPLDPSEPDHVAALVEAFSLRHAVVTSVTRDDLSDGGAAHFASTVTAIRKINPHTTIELLVPDFKGDLSALAVILDAEPDILNHNLETVSRLYLEVRPKADYRRSLSLLAEVKKLNRKIFTKSGIMVGLGEFETEVLELMDDLRKVGCDILTIGQYLRPSSEHLDVVEYVHPEVFAWYETAALKKGFLHVASAPLVRSSYNAAELFTI